MPSAASSSPAWPTPPPSATRSIRGRGRARRDRLVRRGGRQHLGGAALRRRSRARRRHGAARRGDRLVLGDPRSQRRRDDVADRDRAARGRPSDGRGAARARASACCRSVFGGAVRERRDEDAHRAGGAPPRARRRRQGRACATWSRRRGAGQHDLLQVIPVLMVAFEQRDGTGQLAGRRSTSRAGAADGLGDWPRGMVTVMRAAMAHNSGSVAELGEASARGARAVRAQRRPVGSRAVEADAGGVADPRRAARPGAAAQRRVDRA